jgi:predicted tellurium resistance membrane protein TerC
MSFGAFICHYLCNPMYLTDEFHALFTLHGIASLVTLSVLELVLGIDNIIFISLVIAKLPEANRLGARVTGLSFALIMRLLMLFGLVWLSQLKLVLFTASGFQVSIRDALFFVGGGYLVLNTIKELKEHLSGKDTLRQRSRNTVYKNAILQIVLVDVLFSFDSIFTAIGLIQNFVIMAAAIILGMLFMLILSGKISSFINKYPGIKTIALSFIIAVGLILVCSAFHIELPKKYIYLAFFAAFAVEMVR